MNTITLRHIKPWISETYLLLSIVFYWFSTGTLLNTVAIVLLAVLTSLIWLRNRALGIIIGTVFLLLNIYMVFALLSELKQFPSWNGKAFTLLLAGGIYLALNIWMAIRMQVKWATH